MAIAALAAFAIRLYIAINGSYWVDEIVMIQVGRGSTQSVINFLITDTAQGPFSWLIIHWLVRISEAEWFLRLFQVLAGSLSVYYAYFLMRDTMGRRAGLIAAVLMALSLNGINYSTDCRYYSYLVLFSLAMAHHYQAALSTGLKRHYILFGIATLLNIYNGHFAFFLGLIIAIHMFGTIIIRFFKKSGVIPISRFIFLSLAGTAAILLYLPWLGVMLSFFNGPWGIAGGSFVGEATGGTTLDKLLIMIGGRFGIGSFARPESDWHSLVYPILFLLMWVQGKKGMSNRILILFWLVLPLYIMLSVQARHYFTIRYFMIIFPALVLGAAGGIDRLWNWIIAIVKRILPKIITPDRAQLLKTAPLLSAIFIVILSAPFISDLLYYPKQDWKRAVAFVKEHAKPDDFLFLSSGDMIGTYHYLKPCDFGLHVESRDDALPWICSSNHDVWLVSHYFENHSAIFQSWVRSNMELVKVLPGTMIPVYIYRFHREEQVVRGAHILWYPILNPPGNLVKAQTGLSAETALDPVIYPAKTATILGWLDKMTGSFVARIHCTSPPDNKTFNLEIFDGEGKPIQQQMMIWKEQQTPELLWQKSRRMNTAIQMTTGELPVSCKLTEVAQAQSLGPMDGLFLTAGKPVSERMFCTEDGVWQILISTEGNRGKYLSVYADGESLNMQDLGMGIWQAEIGLAWGTHTLRLNPQADMQIKWIIINHELFPDSSLIPREKALIKRVDNLPQGNYLLVARANITKDNQINPLGWIDVYDPVKALTLYRINLNKFPLDLRDQNYFQPSFSSGFPVTRATNLFYQPQKPNEFYKPFRTLGGPVEFYYHELAKDGVEFQSMDLIPFNSDRETSELLAESAVEFVKGAADFHNNVGTLDSSKERPELYVDGEGKGDYLAWGFTCDVPEGVYLLNADITEDSGNFILDNLNDMCGVMEKSIGRKQLFSIVHGMLTLEARVFWTGKGALRLRSIRKENLAGPLDVGILFKRVENYYKKKNRGFSLRDVKELQFDKIIKVFP